LSYRCICQITGSYVYTVVGLDLLGMEDLSRVSPNEQKIFEPFYSTRPKEIGTGLGLSISDGIARDHFGRIEVESEPDRSTTFHLCLPVDGVRRSDVLMEDREGMT